MSNIMKQLVSFTEARTKLSEMVREINESGMEKIIINNNKPRAVLMPIERYYELMKKLDKLGE